MTQRDRSDLDPDEYEPDADLDEVRTDVPEADAIEQHQALVADDRDPVVMIPADAPEADVLEQHQAVEGDDDDPYE